MKKIKIHHLYKNKNKKLFFFQKILVFTISFLTIISLTNFNICSLTKFLGNISLFGKGLIWPQNKIKKYIKDLHNDYLIWPFEKVTNRGIIDEYGYYKALYTDWNKLPEKYKTIFPTEDISNIMEIYKYIPPSNIWNYITNPLERQKVLFFKRLLTTAWTANYKCNDKICLRWIKNTGLHEGQDIITSINTPVRSIATGLVIQKKYDKNGFGNYLIILSEIDEKLFTTFYGHLNNFADNIKEGDIVKQGQIIGYVGKTGLATAPHLHLQINKIGSISEVDNKDLNRIIKKLFFKRTLENIKNNTYDPIIFIQNHSKRKISTSSIGILEKENKIKNLAFATSKKRNFKILKIINSKISGKLTIGDEIKIQIVTTGNFGNIIIISKKGLLKINPNNITPIFKKKEYEIKLIAIKAGNDEITISDGENTYSYTFSIYPKNKSIIKFLQIIGPNIIYKFATNTYKLISIDSLGNIGNIKLNGKLFIKLTDITTAKTIINEKDEIKSNSTSINIVLNQKNLKELDLNHQYKLKIVYIDKNGKTYFVSKKLNPDLFIDYSKNELFSKQINFLASRGIIQGLSGQLLPKKKLTKAELITILVRYKYGNNYETWEKEYIKYYKKNGPLFKDLSENNFRAPYIFKARKNGIIKGYKGYSLYAKKINLLELILVYGRTFNIKNTDNFTIWKNLKDNEEITPYAKAAKKYNLYPFKDVDIFYKNKTINRLDAFVSLYRYINFNIKKTSIQIHASAENQNNQKEILKNLIENLLK